MTPSNPFVVGQWVRAQKFYGRASQLSEVLDGHRNWIWLLGTRRIGKTSLLKQLEHLASSAPEPRFFPVFWDLQGAGDPRELSGTFREAVLDAADRLEGIGIQDKEIESADLFEMLGRLRRRLRTTGLQLLLLCDEVEELIGLNRVEPTILPKLRRVMQSQEGIRAVLASTIRLWALSEQRGDTSPFLHGFTPPVYLRGLGDEEARALVRQENLPGESRPPIPEEIAEEIRSRCDNHPYLMQLVCKRYVELGDVREAIEQVASDQMVSHFFSVDYEMLTPAEQDVLQVIAEATAASSDSILSRLSAEPGELSGMLFRLENLGYIRRNARGQFELINYFFRRWLRDQPRSPVRRASRSPSAADGPPGAEGSAVPLSQRTTQAGGATHVLFDGRYTLMQELGRGATGFVYRARDEMLGEELAVKILKPEYCSNEEVLERFRREILLARDLGHPNILRIYHLGDCQGQRYLAMRLAEGPTLAQMLARPEALDLPLVVDMGWKLASALEAAHGRKIIHRDIKPQNILTDGKGEPYLTDFGLARLLTAPGMTVAGAFMGTPHYASPEQARMQPADERSDLYALGLVLYEMAAGRRPFEADSIEMILEMHRSLPPPDPRRFRNDIPAALGKVILRCLEKDPARRYQTARELRQALGALRPE